MSTTDSYIGHIYVDRWSQCCEPLLLGLFGAHKKKICLECFHWSGVAGWSHSKYRVAILFYRCWKLNKNVVEKGANVDLLKFESLNAFLVFSVFTDSACFFPISGPLLPNMPTIYHSMVRLGKGQAILGGQAAKLGTNDVYQAKIYSMTCSNRNCNISLLDRELSVPKGFFVAIPIPDTISGCITGGKNYFQKDHKRSIQPNICFTPQI